MADVNRRGRYGECIQNVSPQMTSTFSSSLFCDSLRLGSSLSSIFITHVIPYPTAFPYGNVMVLHFYKQQESSTTKTVHKVINKGLKAYVYSPHTGENFH